jgi:hypothetical protein
VGGAVIPYACLMVRVGGPRTLAAALAAAALGLGACGGGGGGGDGVGPPPGNRVGGDEPFPNPSSRTLAQLRRGLGPGPLMASSVSVLEPGRKNRFAFGLFDRARRQIADAPAAVYVAPVNGGRVEGPYPAKHQSLAVPASRRSKTVADDSDAASSIYVANVPFDSEGDYQVLGVTKLDQRVVGGTPVTVSVSKPKTPPAVGDLAPRVHTPTRADVRNLSEIDTRVPPSSMHEDDLADVLGHRPVMLLFATPRLCRSRVCGPVVDVLEEVKARNPNAAAFIHMEVWNKNSVDQGQRPQVRAYGLPSEPWLFAIDAHGRVAERIEGAFSADEAEAALRKAMGR